MRRTFTVVLDLIAAVAAFVGLVYGVLVAAHVFEPAATTVSGLTPRRIWATTAAGLALPGVVVGGVALVRRIGDGGRRLPRARVHDVHREVRLAGAAANQVAAAIGRDVFGALAAIRRELHGHQPAAVAARHQRAVDVRDECRSDHPAIDGRRQVGFEDHVHPVLQHPGAVPAYADGIANAALRPVGADQVLRPNPGLGAGRSIADSRQHRVAFVREAHQLGVEADVGAVPLGLGAQNWRIRGT